MLLGIGGWYGRRAYQNLKHTRALAQARTFLQKSDLRNASLSLRQALMAKPRSVEATRLMADLAKLVNSPEELTWRKRLVELEPDVALDRLAWSSTALRLGNIAEAQQALETMKEADRNTANFHSASASVALALKQTGRAEAEFDQALKLDPENLMYQYNLAVLRISSTNTAQASEARRKLVELSGDPRASAEALRALVSEDYTRERFSQALVASQKLLADPRAEFSDQLTHLNVLLKAGPNDVDAFLAKCQKEAQTNPVKIGALAQWMIVNDRARPAQGWIEGVPASMKSQLPVQIVRADCYQALKAW